MKFSTYAICSVMIVAGISCSHKQEKQKDRSAEVPTSTEVQSASNPSTVDAQKKAAKLTKGWPQSSVTAATETVERHGEPVEVTDDSLVWRNVAPFERIIVHKEVHSSKFPVLHQNAVDHVVAYKVPVNMIEEVREFNGDIVIDGTKGEMTASGENEAMNILALNMANEVITGKLSSAEARTQYGKESLAFMNGEKTAYTQSLKFGQQVNTSDKGQSVTEDINWKGDAPKAEETKQSQEETPVMDEVQE